MTVAEKKLKKKKTVEESPQTKFQTMRDDMNRSLIEREGEVDVVLTALVCGENPLLVGPPGTAKSLLLDTIMKWMGEGTKKFSILLNKYTTAEEVFGPISVKGLKEDVYRRITTGKLPEADVAFGDEIFKASTAILNTMLRILNERVYENGDGVFRRVPLQIFVAGSNEFPNDQEGGKELGALFDRFLIRKKVRPISSKFGRNQLLWKRDHEPSLSSTVTVDEIKQARRESKQLDFSKDAMNAVLEILDTLNREGIRPGDRRQYKSIDAVKAYAYIMGVKQDEEIEPEHLEILAHILWDDPTEQPEKCAEIVAKIANPSGMKINQMILQMEDILANNKPHDAIPKLQDIQKNLVEMRDSVSEMNSNKLEDAIEHVTELIKVTYNRMIHYGNS